MAAISGISGLRERRVRSGLTQEELATRAGVSRQLVAAVEAGRNVPAVDAAMRLAVALGATVEEVFSPLPGTRVVAALGGRLRERSPVRVGRVGEGLVASELADHGAAGAAWASPDAIVDRGALRWLPGAAPAGFVIAGCDPALGVAETVLHGLGPRSLLAISAATGTALEALRAGRVHAALVHGPQAALPAAPVPVLRLQFARWEVGVALPSALGYRSLDAVLDARISIVQRGPAAASQQALERAAARLGSAAPSAERRADGHIDAARLAATLGCAAVTTEAAAAAFGLRFLALEEHTVEAWIAERWLEQPGVEAFGELLQSSTFTQRVGAIAGYDLAQCGTRR